MWRSATHGLLGRLVWYGMVLCGVRWGRSGVGVGVGGGGVRVGGGGEGDLAVAKAAGEGAGAAGRSRASLPSGRSVRYAISLAGHVCVTLTFTLVPFGVLGYRAVRRCRQPTGVRLIHTVHGPEVSKLSLRGGPAWSWTWRGGNSGRSPVRARRRDRSSSSVSSSSGRRRPGRWSGL